MAKIQGERPEKKPGKAGRIPSASGIGTPAWLPLAVALAGLVVVLSAPESVEWWIKSLALVAFGTGLYLLGRRHGEAAPDIAARGRVVQLERALSQIWAVSRMGRAGTPAGPEPPVEAEEPRRDEGDDRSEPGHESRRLGATADLDAALPGE